VEGASSPAGFGSRRPSRSAGRRSVRQLIAAFWHNSCVPCGCAGPPRDSRHHPCPCVGPNLSSVRLGPKPRRLAASEIAKTLKIRRASSPYWMPAGGAAGRPDGSRFAAHEKTPVACEKSSPQGQNGPDSRSPGIPNARPRSKAAGSGRASARWLSGVCYHEGARAGSRSGLPIPNDP
jgi:hypothetical protein